MLNFTAGKKALRLRHPHRAAAHRARRPSASSRPASFEELIAALSRDRVRAGRQDAHRLSRGRARRHRHRRQARAAPSRAALASASTGPAPEKADKPAVILFTSGTEGAPKGVVLTNANLLANAQQSIAPPAAACWSRARSLLNPLPMFHSFGLTAGTLTPLFAGVKCVLYPSPLHYRQVPEVHREGEGDAGSSSTDTFLAGYARAAEPGQLASLNYAVAGAERVKEPTRAIVRASPARVLLEGYGVTETAPVLACNLPDNNRDGTVGRLLPGIEARLEDGSWPQRRQAAVRARAQRHGRLSARRQSRRRRPPAGRLARHRRHRHHGRRLRRHPRARQALRQARRRDGVAGRRRDAGLRAVERRPARRPQLPRPAQGRAAAARHRQAATPARTHCSRTPAARASPISGFPRKFSSSPPCRSSPPARSTCRRPSPWPSKPVRRLIETCFGDAQNRLSRKRAWQRHNAPMRSRGTPSTALDRGPALLHGWCP